MMKKAAIAGVVLAVAGIALFLVSHFRHNREEGVIAVSGNVEVTEVNMGFKLPGRIVELFVDEGQRVKKGDRLAALDTSELEEIVSQGRAYLGEMLVRREDLRKGARIQEIEEAAENAKAADAEYEKAQRDYERAERLYRKSVIPASQYDAAKALYDAREAHVKAAREHLSMIKEGPRKDEIRAADNRVEQARAALAAAETRLGDAVIYAPGAGVILKKYAEAGETIAQGIPVFDLGDLENPWVKVYVKEDKLGLVRLGQKARITVDSYPGKVYEGTVTFISSEAEFTPKNIQTQEERVKLVFGIKVGLKNVNDELKPGMPADVKILVK